MGVGAGRCPKIQGVALDNVVSGFQPAMVNSVIINQKCFRNFTVLIFVIIGNVSQSLKG
jgi:hypothetical protein